MAVRHPYSEGYRAACRDFEHRMNIKERTPNPYPESNIELLLSEIGYGSAGVVPNRDHAAWNHGYEQGEEDVVNWWRVG